VGGAEAYIADMMTVQRSPTRTIDELGFDPMTRQEASLLLRLVSYRHTGRHEDRHHQERG